METQEVACKGKPVVQSLWIGRELSMMEQLCSLSFLKNGHKFYLYTYHDVKNVPPGVEIKDASELINPDKIFKYQKRDTYSGFANLFRYKLLLEKGGFWVDTDVVCLRPFDDGSEYVFAKSRSTEPSGYTNGSYDMENCVIKAPAGSAIMEFCYEESLRRDPKELEFCETGPDLLETAVRKFGFEDYIASAGTYCPISYRNWSRVIDGKLAVSFLEMVRFALNRSKGLHLWNEMWRLNGVKKNALFPKYCIYERLKRRYLVPPPPKAYEINLDENLLRPG
jgi:hypothetical protein